MQLDPIVFLWLIIQIDFMDQLLISLLEVTDQGVNYIGSARLANWTFWKFCSVSKATDQKKIIHPELTSRE